MLEKRTRPDELRADDVFANVDLRQHLANWRHFAARHDDGGHVLVATVPSSTTRTTPSPPTQLVSKTVEQTTTGQKLSGIRWSGASVNRRGWAKGDRL